MVIYNVDMMRARRELPSCCPPRLQCRSKNGGRFQLEHGVMNGACWFFPRTPAGVDGKNLVHTVVIMALPSCSTQVRRNRDVLQCSSCSEPLGSPQPSLTSYLLSESVLVPYGHLKVLQWGCNVKLIIPGIIRDIG